MESEERSAPDDDDDETPVLRMKNEAGEESMMAADGEVAEEEADDEKSAEELLLRCDDLRDERDADEVVRLVGFLGVDRVQAGITRSLHSSANRMYKARRCQS